MLDKVINEYLKKGPETKLFNDILYKCGRKAYACKEYLFSYDLWLEFVKLYVLAEVPDTTISKHVYISNSKESLKIYKSIYEFPTEVYEELTKSDLPNEVPMYVLRRIPEWGFFIKLESDKFHGVVVSILNGSKDGEYHDSILLDFLDKEDLSKSQIVVLPLWDKEAYDVMTLVDEKSGTISAEPSLQESLKHTIQLLLYLCSESVDYEGNKTPTMCRSPYKGKKGWRIYPSDKITYRLVGVETERKLKEYKEQLTFNNKGKLPHLRRGHWHGYWTGKGRTNYKLNWVFPVFVNKGE